MTLTIDVVNHALGKPSITRSTPNVFHTKFRQFVDNVIRRAEVAVPMLLITASYIMRSKNFIYISKPDWAFERVFLGALVVATKVDSISDPSRTSLTDLRSIITTFR